MPRTRKGLGPQVPTQATKRDSGVERREVRHLLVGAGHAAANALRAVRRAAARSASKRPAPGKRVN